MEIETVGQVRDPRTRRTNSQTGEKRAWRDGPWIPGIVASLPVIEKG